MTYYRPTIVVNGQQMQANTTNTVYQQRPNPPKNEVQKSSIEKLFDSAANKVNDVTRPAIDATEKAINDVTDAFARFTGLKPAQPAPAPVHAPAPTQYQINIQEQRRPQYVAQNPVPTRAPSYPEVETLHPIMPNQTQAPVAGGYYAPNMNPTPVAGGYPTQNTNPYAANQQQMSGYPVYSDPGAAQQNPYAELM